MEERKSDQENRSFKWERKSSSQKSDCL